MPWYVWFLLSAWLLFPLLLVFAAVEVGSREPSVDVPDFVPEAWTKDATR